LFQTQLKKLQRSLYLKKMNIVDKNSNFDVKFCTNVNTNKFKPS